MAGFDRYRYGQFQGELKFLAEPPDLCYVDVRREKGFVLLASVFALILIGGLVGLVADTAQLQIARQRAQTAADAAAVAAWQELRQGNTAGMQRAAESDVRRNGIAVDVDTRVAVHCPPSGGDYASDAGAVEATIDTLAPTIFMRAFGRNAVTVHSRAVAVASASGAVTLGE